MSNDNTGHALATIEFVARSLAFPDQQVTYLRLARTQLQVALGERVTEDNEGAGRDPR